MKKITVKLGRRSYDILIGYDDFPVMAKHMRHLLPGRDAVVITNARMQGVFLSRIAPFLKRSGFNMEFQIIPDSETSKSDRIFIKTINNIACMDKEKRVFIIAFGGGVVGDLAGFIAATYKRGIPYVQIPTTLLSQVDSAIGGKTGIDLKCGKNLIGAFYQPLLVFSDLSILKTLSQRQIRAGLAEVIKYAVIADKDFFEYLEENIENILALEAGSLEKIIYTCARIKADFVAADERDVLGKRAFLNFGHTIGHAIETAGGYSKRYTHGEAVAIGMCCASKIAFRMNLADQGVAVRIENLIIKAGLPSRFCGPELSDIDIMEALWHDKKFIHAKTRFVLPVSIGRVKLYEDVPVDLIKDVLRESRCAK